MKVTDYCPRACPFDSYLKGKDLVGIEVGVDVGAHAEALLLYCSIKKLSLVDIWDKEFYLGYAKGRLRWYRNTEYIQKTSQQAASLFENESFDFIYIDQKHDYESVKSDLDLWWPKLKSGGVLGYRNYTNSNTPLALAVNEFIAKVKPVHKIELGEIVIFK